ncbi:potassium-transporting ATPase subunit KdpA [Hydrogenobacter hydrogenophilus]|uniref:Potassium-transporting ATPase potassium-binding subunit n=1 Tax=Hydrogenobacter hydrogenophilus TaxID=35835 RepID=A0A285NTU6_9AQUI|nr:potassium-transporting ATPase subunit KdpA [Hydrogenobacter hydrogenophilus]SNZ12932.1 K+-transporting ATPase ATPase A chain [Hydrogenobacter hydrogenophilus]
MQTLIPDVLTFVVFLVLLSLIRPLLGEYMARVFSAKLLPGEALICKVLGIDPQKEMNWKEYAFHLLSFNILGMVVLFLLLVFQGYLPLNPQGFGGFSWNLALNTAVSFTTNTNWQAYSGENTISYLSQMMGLAVQNFLSASTGIVVVLALLRGITRAETPYIGNFWVDITRATLYVLLPISVFGAIFLVSQGVIQNLDPYVKVKLLDPAFGGKEQIIPMGPVASQEVIKLLGTNGGGFFGANSAHPFENPTPLSNFFECLLMLMIPASLTYTFGKLTGRRRLGLVLYGVMLAIFVSALIFEYLYMSKPHPDFARMGIEGPYVEGQETRFGISGSALFGVVTDSAETGAVNGMFDSYLPLAGMIPLMLMALGVAFGGVGAGLYGMIAYMIISAFIAGLMVGRVPEFLQKKLYPRDMWASVIAALTSTFLILFLSSVALKTKAGTTSILNPGPHGITEVLYAYTSTANNNGSAFAGLNANTIFYNLSTAFAMFVGRYVPIVALLFLAGSFSHKKTVPQSPHNLREDSLVFAIWLIFVILLINVLGLFPALSMGPVLEHFLLYAGN